MTFVINVRPFRAFEGTVRERERDIHSGGWRSGGNGVIIIPTLHISNHNDIYLIFYYVCVYMSIVEKSVVRQIPHEITFYNNLNKYKNRNIEVEARR